jgi:hypothetical protein
MIKNNNRYSNSDGQALVELMLVVVLSFILGIGFYEVGALVHNISVMNKGLSSAANYASRGAPYSKIKEVMLTESKNLLGGAFLEQEVSDDFGLILEVWNPETDSKLGTYTEGNYTYRPTCSKRLPPEKKYVTPYIFWANGYEIRVGVEYDIGIYIPFLGVMSISPTLTSAKRITAQNDIDRDGMVDSREATYVDWALDKKSSLLLISDTQWRHPVHRDETATLDSKSMNNDLDGDGFSVSGDTYPFDRNNDGVQDKFDKAEATNRDNMMTMNPLVGPGIALGSNPSWKWWDGTCPPQ